MGRTDNDSVGMTGNLPFPSQMVINRIGHSGVRIHEIIIVFVHLAHGMGHIFRRSPAAHHFHVCLGKGLFGNFILSFLLQSVHTFPHLLCRACKVVEEPFKIGGNENIHGRCFGHVERTVDIIYTGFKEVRQYFVFIGSADQSANGGSHLLCQPGSQDIAEIAGRHYHVERFMFADGTIFQKLQPDPYIVHHLRQKTADINGIGAGEKNALFCFLFPKAASENLLQRSLGIIKIAFNTHHLHIAAQLLLHLILLQRADTMGRIENHNMDARHIAESLQCCFSRIAGSGSQNQDFLIILFLFLCIYKKIGEKRQRQIFESTGPAMEHFRHGKCLGQGLDRYNVFCFKSTGISTVSQLFQLFFRNIREEMGQHERCQLLIGHIFQFICMKKRSREKFRHIQAAVISQPFHQRLFCRYCFITSGTSVFHRTPPKNFSRLHLFYHKWQGRDRAFCGALPSP